MKENNKEDNAIEGMRGELDPEFAAWQKKYARQHDENYRVKKDITFSIQQTVACMLTDFIDPFVSTFLQKRWGNKDKKAATLEENVKGEVVGDLGGAVAFVGLRALFRTPLDAVVRGVDALAHPALQKLGNAHLSLWAKKHHLDTEGKTYKDTLDNFTHYQTETWVDSALLAVSSSTINVLSQKHLFGNQQSYGTIAGSKLVGVALTMGSILGMRATFPDTSVALDKELNHKYVAPVVRLLSDEPRQNASLQGKKNEGWVQKMHDTIGGMGSENIVIQL